MLCLENSLLCKQNGITSQGGCDKTAVENRYLETCKVAVFNRSIVYRVYPVGFQPLFALCFVREKDFHKVWAGTLQNSIAE